MEGEEVTHPESAMISFLRQRLQNALILWLFLAQPGIHCFQVFKPKLGLGI